MESNWTLSRYVLRTTVPYGAMMFRGVALNESSNTRMQFCLPSADHAYRYRSVPGRVRYVPGTYFILHTPFIRVCSYCVQAEGRSWGRAGPGRVERECEREKRKRPRLAVRYGTVPAQIRAFRRKKLTQGFRVHLLR